MTLVWTDPPAQPISQNPLINNLDLEVTIGGQTSLGNGAADAVNTVEQVSIASGATGQATVKVKGTGVPQGPQKYALVVTGPLSITSPPPAAPNPPPPWPPAAPLGDMIAIGITVPLLLMAVGAGGCFLCRRKAGAGGGAVVGGGIGRKSVKGNLLPPGWRQLKDPTSGAFYYLNEKTNETTWDPPAMPKPPAPASESLPAPWTAVLDPASGRSYYYNSATGAVSWNKPTA